MAYGLIERWIIMGGWISGFWDSGGGMRCDVLLGAGMVGVGRGRCERDENL